MRFLLKLTVFGFLGLALLPSFSPLDESGDQAGTVNASNVDGSEFRSDAIGFAAGIARDFGQLCFRQPEVCKVGGQLAMTAVERAKQGAHIVIDMVEQHRAENARVDHKTATGSID